MSADRQRLMPAGHWDWSIPVPFSQGWRAGDWRDDQQKQQLLTGDISPFFAGFDFTKLSGGVNDDLTGKRGGVPTTGYIQRMLRRSTKRPVTTAPAANARPNPSSRLP